MKFLKKLLIALPLVAMLAGCGCNNKSGGDEDVEVDYVAQTHIPAYSSITTYEGKNFLDNGIGEVTLYNPVDGDTAHFHQVENDGREKARLVKVRFYGIDTPESTGQIEPWGKKASKFTTEKLQEAKTIVLTNGTLLETAAETDSTGTRYKALVWVSENEHASLDELKCLNLWVVQEGFSNGKGVADCPLAQVFNDADLQAQKLKKNIWSGDDPDFYTGDAVSTSIKDLVDEYVDNNGGAHSMEGTKVKINGIVAKVVGDDAYVVQDFENETTGETERYGLFIFAGYKNYRALKTIGNDLTIIGTFTIRYGNPQLTSVKYNPAKSDKDDMVINQQGVLKPALESTFSEVDLNRRYVNVVCKFSHLTATGYGYNEKDATTGVYSGAMNIEVKDTSGHKMTLRVPKNVYLMKKDATSSLDRVTDYKYLYENNLEFDLECAIQVYDPTRPEDSQSASGGIYWQLTLCNKDDVVYY